ncbi:MAG: hypothetical protein ACRDJ4_01465 [Actinomycetota bacterium]
MGAAGDNFAFTRVRRNASGTPATVTAHFLVSPLGTGSNYQDAGATPDPSISFAAGDLVQTMAVGYPWHLDPTSTTHLCLAVEISTPADPFVSPSLVGRAPGWPTTDLAVLNDNNKAQRNMEPGPAGGSGSISFYGLVHNAATFRRDLVLRYRALAEARERLKGLKVAMVGERASSRPDGTLLLKGMEPGENRWVSLTVEAESAKAHPLPVVFEEVVGGAVVNGFAIAPQPMPLAEMIRRNLEFHAFSFGRMAAAFGIEEAAECAEAARKLADAKRLPAARYLAFLSARGASMSDCCQRLVGMSERKDPFTLRPTLASLARAVRAGDAERVAPLHATLAHKLDAFQTMLQKDAGDPADILQMVEWQRRLYGELPELRRLGASVGFQVQSQEFVRSYESHKVGNDAYPNLIRSVCEALEEAAEALPRLGLRERLERLRGALGSPARLQRAHRDVLLALASLER